MCINLCFGEIYFILSKLDVGKLVAKFGLLSVFENKVLLENSHSHLFIYCLWSLLQQRPFGLQSLKSLLYDSFYKKFAKL